MKKRELFKYTSSHIVKAVVDIDLEHKNVIKTITVNMRYNSAKIEIKTDMGNFSVLLQATGDMNVRWIEINGGLTDFGFYEWQENTADKLVAQQLSECFKQYVILSETAFNVIEVDDDSTLEKYEEKIKLFVEAVENAKKAVNER